jgi:ribonuclease HIII
MKDIVNHYKTLLEGEKFYATGSLALAYMGLCEFSEVHDIDIVVVNPTDECKNIVNRLVKEHPLSTPSYSVYRFRHEKTNIDVFFVGSSEKTRTIPSGDGFDIATVASIIKAKKGYDRLKDWVQLWNMGQNFCTENELMTAVKKFR